MDFDAYDLDSAFYDEMFLPDGTPRVHCRNLHESLLQLPVEELVRMQERVTHSFSSEGITCTVYGGDEAGERIMPGDCLPRILPAPDPARRRMAAARSRACPADEGVEPVSRRRLRSRPHCRRRSRTGRPGARLSPVPRRNAGSARAARDVCRGLRHRPGSHE